MAVVNNKIKDICTLTPLQEGMLFFNLMSKETGQYVIQNSFDTKFDLDVNLVKQTLDLVSLRYSVLRTFFLYENVKQNCQVVLKERTLEYDYQDWSDLGNQQQEELFADYLSKDLKRGFDLKEDTLLRVKHIRLGENKNRILFTMHHIIIDGWCVSTIFQKFFSYYLMLCNGETYDEMVNKVKEEENSEGSYSEYIKWLNSKNKEDAKEYWKGLLEGYDSVCAIKSTQNPEPCSEHMIESYLRLDTGTTDAIAKLANRTESTVNIVAETVVGILLQSYSGSKDVVFGKVVSGRNAPVVGIENMVGLFINTIPVRVTAEDGLTFEELIKRQHKQEIESTNYDYCSLSDIQSMTAQGSDLIKVLFVFENFLSGLNNNQEGHSGNDDSISSGFAREQTSFDVTISAMESDGQLVFKIMYDPNVYSEDEIEILKERIEKVCREIAAEPHKLISEIETVTDKEKALILDDFNATDTIYPSNKTIVELFEEQVRRTPDSIAVIFNNQILTYSQLNARANIIANKLRNFGVTPGDFIAIAAERSTEMICGIYGIIKSGAAYVPIDPSYPEERIRYILEDCKPKAFLKYTDKKIVIDQQIPVIDLSSEIAWVGSEADPVLVNKPEDFIYCIYTSGTTGKPKGVPNRHTGLINRIFWMNSRYPVTQGDTILQKTTFTFDVSVWEIIWWSLTGARVALLNPGGEKDPEQICNAIEAYKVTTMHFVPSMLAMFEEYLLDFDGMIGKLHSLRNVFSSGEALKNKYVEQFYAISMSNNLGMQLINLYGPTEASIDVTYYDCTSDDIYTVPIGKPIYNTKLYILDKNKLCGIGIPGELCITGVGLAAGYMNRPELTNEKFVDNPFGYGKMYRTGDLARWLPDGNIDYLGRIDEQVKIRGFRIELGEIESRIREIPGIKDCAVIAKEDSTGNKAIYAYYTSDTEKSVSEVRDSLNDVMPEYMIPSYMQQIETIPVTGNGKLNKRALPEIETRTIREYVAPSNETEENICRIFSEILNIEKVGVKDNFFELGGDSIKAVRITSKLKALKYDVAVGDIISEKTAEKIAVKLESKSDNSSEVNYLTLISDKKKKNSLICFPFGGGDEASFIQLTAEVTKRNDEISVYALRSCNCEEEQLADIMNEISRIVDESENTVFYSHCAGAGMLVKTCANLPNISKVKHVIIAATAPGKVKKIFGKTINPYNAMSDKVLKMMLVKAGAQFGELTDEEITDFLRKFRSDVEKYGEDCTKYTEPINNAGSIIVSEADPYTPNAEAVRKEWQKRFRETITMHLIDNADHYFHKSRADEVAEIIVSKF